MHRTMLRLHRVTTLGKPALHVLPFTCGLTSNALGCSVRHLILEFAPQQFMERLENPVIMKYSSHLEGNKGEFILNQTWVVITKKHKFRLP